jgi:hypothetical protein
MDSFNIKIEVPATRGIDDPLPICVSVGDFVFTRLLRPGSDQADNSLVAPPSQLAFWFVDNWWRLRFLISDEPQHAPQTRSG